MPRAKSATPDIPAWVPEPARRRINELREPLKIDDIGRDLLNRLATHEAMKTNVWKRLPLASKGFEGKIIDWAFEAFTIFLALPRPFPKKRAKRVAWVEHRQKHLPLVDFAYVSGLALLLSEQIYISKPQTASHWAHFWQGDKSVTPDQVLKILDHLNLFYFRMDEENRALLASLPKVRRWNANAAQKFFAEHLSRRMIETYKKPFDPIVTTLTEVAFDLPQGLEVETVRGRRRGASASETSGRK